MAQITSQQAYELAVKHHQAGQLTEAERLYQQVLGANPRHCDAMQNLGVLAKQVGNSAAAAELFRRVTMLRPDHADAFNNLGVTLRDIKRLDDAVIACRKAISLRATYAQAHFNLGLALNDLGKTGEAIAAYSRAIALKPGYAEAHSSLGAALAKTGNLNEAIAAYRRAIKLSPGYAQPHNYLGIALTEKGELDQAIDELKQAIVLQPNYAEAHNNLGNAFKARQDHPRAIAAYRQALAINPTYTDALNNLAIALRADRQLREAINVYEQSLAIKADDVEAYLGLGNTYRDLHQVDRSIAAYERAVALKPDYPEALSNYAAALIDAKRSDDAISACRRALALRPDFADALNNLGTALGEKGELVEAEEVCRKALALKPDQPETIANLAGVLASQGHLDDSLAHYRRAIALRPHYIDVHTVMLFLMNFNPNCDPREVAREHFVWDRKYAQPLAEKMRSHLNDRGTDRRLRIGYVSPDFRAHSVAHFFLPLVNSHDHQSFEIFCYGNVQPEDLVTQQIRAAADCYRSIVGLTDDEAAQIIREDHIDILVDLAGHTAGTRLLLFAMKPAPVQVSFLGYPATTGLKAIDYRLSDAVADPPGMTDEFCAEVIVRLRRCAWCYQPLKPPPPLSDPPVIKNGFITFGCFNSFTKVNDPLLRDWAAILHRVPGSRLFLKALNLRSPLVRERVIKVMGEAGIDPERLDLRSWVDAADHLTLYNSVDIALDTYPYNGTTTTIEALNMGVPVIAWAGQSHVARVGASLLLHLGLGDLVGQTPLQMIDIAAALANDLPRLRELRWTLRDRLLQSPLMDAPGYAREIEFAYRSMWKRWASPAGTVCDV